MLWQIGFLGTSLLEVVKFLTSDFSHSTLVWGQQAQSKDRVYKVKRALGNHRENFYPAVLPTLTPSQLLGTSEVLSVRQIAPQMYPAAC